MRKKKIPLLAGKQKHQSWKVSSQETQIFLVTTLVSRAQRSAFFFCEINRLASFQSSLHPLPFKERTRAVRQLFFFRSSLGYRSATSNGYNQDIGRWTIYPLFSLGRSIAVHLFPAGYISFTQPKYHCLRGVFWSRASTSSPTFRFTLFSFPFFLKFNVAMKSSLLRLQNVLNKLWISLHRFL